MTLKRNITVGKKLLKNVRSYDYRRGEGIQCVYTVLENFRREGKTAPISGMSKYRILKKDIRA